MKGFKRGGLLYCINLSCELNINKVYRIDNEQATADLKVNRKFLWKAFNIKFYIEFGHCYRCLLCVHLD